MGIREVMTLIAGALALSTLPSFAGPCSQEIDQMQAKMNARLEARGRRWAGRAGEFCGHDAPLADSKGRSRQPKASLATFLPRPCRL